jgi:hypothetical protein
VEGGAPEEDHLSLLFIREEDSTDNGSTISGTILIMEALGTHHQTYIA